MPFFVKILVRSWLLCHTHFDTLQVTKKKVKILNYVHTVKGIDAIVTTPCNCLNWKKKKKKQNNNNNNNKLRYLNVFFVIFLAK